MQGIPQEIIENLGIPPEIIETRGIHLETIETQGFLLEIWIEAIRETDLEIEESHQNPVREIIQQETIERLTEVTPRIRTEVGRTYPETTKNRGRADGILTEMNHKTEVEILIEVVGTTETTQQEVLTVTEQETAATTSARTTEQTLVAMDHQIEVKLSTRLKVTPTKTTVMAQSARNGMRPKRT